MELRQIRYVIAVAEELHFGRAAQRLHMTQPSLSRQVRAVEQEIGVDLFDRTSRGAKLTPAGAEFAANSGRALELIASIIQRTQEVGRGAAGHVSLGFVATAALDILPQALAAYRTERPGVVVTLSELTTEQQIEALLAGGLDVGLGRDVRMVEGLRSEALRREPVVVALPADHPLTESDALTLDDLAGQCMVRMPRERARLIDDLLRRIPTSVDRTVGAVTPEAGQYMTLLALVAADMGAALVPESVCSLQSVGVHYVPLAEADASTSLMITTRSDLGHPAADHLRTVLLAEFGHPSRAAR